MEKILPVYDPPIKLYLNHSYILSVLLGNEDSWAWIYSNYIQLTFFKNFKEINKFSVNYYIGNMSKYFYSIPFLEIRVIDKDFFIQENKSIIEYVCGSINSGYYIMTIADEFYLRCKTLYKKEHFMHLTMIHGYNSGIETLYTTGFNVNGIFTKQTFSYNEFESAFLSEEGFNKNIRDNYIMLIRHVDKTKLKYPQNNFNYFDYKFDICLVKETLEEYLYSKCTADKLRLFFAPGDNIGYGMSVYEYLKLYFYYAIEETLSEIDIRGLHGVMEHKNLMVKRVEYMVRNGYIANADTSIFKEAASKAAVLRNLVLKYNSRNQKETLGEAIKIVDILKQLEATAIQRLLICL